MRTIFTLAHYGSPAGIHPCPEASGRADQVGATAVSVSSPEKYKNTPYLEATQMWSIPNRTWRGKWGKCTYCFTYSF
jgi:hypothetical protein